MAGRNPLPTSPILESKNGGGERWFWQMSYAEEAECVNRIKDFTISESYKIYYAFWDFICSTKPVVRIWQVKDKYESIDRYYSRVKRMEEWRKKSEQDSVSDNS
jgi:hypothetical protein